MISNPTIEDVLARAVDRGVDADTMEKLVNLQLRVMEKNAEMAFNRAFQAFQAECPSVAKNKTADTGKFKYKYADLDHIVEVVRPVLQRHGLSFTFDSQMDEKSCAVTCHLHHVDGHSRSAKVVLPAYTFDKINALQCEGVRNSYGRRYALLSVLGITTGDPDTDGNMPTPPQHQQRPRRQVSRADLESLIADWKQWTNGTKEQFAAWAQSVCGIPAGSELNADVWTWDAIETGRGNIQGAPIDTEAAFSL